MTSSDSARVKLFSKCKMPDALPPTSDALKFHIQRAHYQSMVLRQASNPQPVLPSPSEMGWTLKEGVLSPKFVSLHPMSTSCADIISCACTKGCKSHSCSCRKGKLVCTGTCRCADSDIDCMNRSG